MDYYRFCEAARERKINLNSDDISDIIIGSLKRKKIFYKNTVTGKSSRSLMDVIRKDKRFLVFTAKHPFIAKNNESLAGFYVYHDKLTDIIYLINAALKKRGSRYYWAETSRSAYDKNTGYVYSDSRCCFVPAYACDICGQTIFPLFHPDNYEPVRLPDSLSTYLDLKPACIGAKNTILSYLGNVPVFKGILLSFDEPFHFDRFLEGMMYGGVKFRVMRPLASLEVDVKTKSRLKSYTRNVINDYFQQGLQKNILFSSVQYIEECDGDLFAEKLCIIYHYDSLGSVSTSFVDGGRLRVGIGTFDDLIIGRGRFPENMKTSAAFIDEWLNMLDYMARDSGVSGWSVSFAVNEYCQKRSFLPYRAVSLAWIFAKEPLLEKIFCVKEADDKFKKDFLWHAAGINNEKDINMFIEKNFGKTVNGKSLNKSLLLPKGFFEYMVQKNAWSSIAEYKQVFSGAEADMEYFMRMNREDFVEFVERCHSTDEIFSIIKILISLYGASNWRGYMDNIDRVAENGLYDDYKMYVKTLYEEKTHAAEFPWKVNSSMGIYNHFMLLCSYIKNLSVDRYLPYFEGRYAEWRKYEYGNGTFLIRYPRRPAELVIEGIALRHCAREFIESVASGDTNILFIRRSCEPDKPFYTLEIKNRKIRQCHGFANKNLPYDSPLAEFLQKFCIHCGIQFSYGEEKAGPGL